MAEIEYYEHTCGCGCSGKIEVKRHHKYTSIPNFLTGHNCTGIKRGKMTEEHKKKISNTKKENPTKYWEGRTRSKETKELISQKLVGRDAWNKGIPNPTILGENNPNWNGGTTLEHKAIRSSIPYKEWRDSVFERDSFTCKKCGDKGVFLHPHHIQNFSEHEELRFDIENGITLCKSCHNGFHKQFGYKENSLNQLSQYLKEACYG